MRHKCQETCVAHDKDNDQDTKQDPAAFYATAFQFRNYSRCAEKREYQNDYPAWDEYWIDVP